MSAEPAAEQAAEDQSPAERWYDLLQQDNRKGDRAALRRAQQTDDAYGVCSFHLLLVWLGKQKPPDVAARIAMALAPIRQDRMEQQADGNDDDDPAEAPAADQPRSWAGTKLGRCMAAKGPSGAPRISPARVRLLLSTENPDQFLRLLRSILGQLDGRAPVREVADVMDGWHSPTWRAAIRRRIFLSYFSNVDVKESKNA